jgi:hypothetical protein
VRAALTSHRVELTAAAGLTSLYLAIMNGHLASIDGLVMWREALALTAHHSLSFNPPFWWGGGFIFTSTRGLAASLQYTPGIAALSWLRPAYLPNPSLAADDFGLLYADRLYQVAGAPVWVLVTALTALLVGLSTKTLGGSDRASLWAMALYGIGSPALLGARGDWPQPLVALCWSAGIWSCARIRAGGSGRWWWLCSAAIVYGVLTRPLEGSMLLPAALVWLAPELRVRPTRGAVLVGSWIGAVLVTLLVNWARFGSATNFGYGAISWSIPIWVGFPYAFLSPGRGALWQFPAMILGVLGAFALWRNGRRLEAVVLSAVPTVLFLESCVYFAWIDGWDWGFRLFQPALPLVAVLAGIGAVQLRGRFSRWVPAVLLAGGVVWNVPAVATDLLGGYAATYDNLASWSRLDAYPPLGAWQFLHHVRAMSPDDSAAVDVVWFRIARTTNWLSLLPFAALLATAGGLWQRAIRSQSVEQA